MRNKNRKGVTLTEIMIVVAVLGGLSLVAAAGGRLFNVLQREMTRVRVERDTQVAMQQIIGDIQNAKYVIDMGPDYLMLRVYDFRRFGFDVAQDTFTASPSGTKYHLFDEVAMGTATYQFMTSGADSYLAYTATFGDSATTVPRRTVNRTMFKNQLRPPTASAPMFLANPKPGGTTITEQEVKSSTDSIRIVIAVNEGFFKKEPETYEEDVALRSYNGVLGP